MTEITTPVLPRAGYPSAWREERRLELRPSTSEYASARLGAMMPFLRVLPKAHARLVPSWTGQRASALGVEGRMRMARPFSSLRSRRRAACADRGREETGRART